jgi:hypothetical protein
MSEDAGWQEKKRKQTGLDCAGLRGKANAGRRILVPCGLLSVGGLEVGC